MSLVFDPAEVAEAQRVNRLLAATPRLPLRSTWDVAVLNGALRFSQALPDRSLRRIGIAVEERKVEALGRHVMVRILRPRGPCTGVYLDVHGGAWVLGNARMDDRLNAAVVEDCGMAVVSVDYRLAPVNPISVVLEDCETAAAWTLAHMKAEFGTETLFVGGESAGAHLAASTVIRMRDNPLGLSAVAGVVLFYGCYDLAGTKSLLSAGPDTLVLHGPTLAHSLGKLLAAYSEEERRHPTLSPLYADLTGLPPALFVVGTRDPLMDDTLLMHERWIAAGNAADLIVVPEAPHAFNRLPTAMARKTNAYMHGWMVGALARRAHPRAEETEAA